MSDTVTKEDKQRWKTKADHPLRTLIALAEHHDMDLATVIERWPFLSPHIRTKVRNTVTDYT